MKKYLLTSVVLAAILVSCSAQQTAPPRPADFVVVGLNPDQPPFAYRDSSGPCVGFDVELLSMICQANRWQCEFRPMAFDSLRDALVRGDIDIAVGEISTSNGDSTQIARSDPYYLTGLVMIVASAQPMPVGEASWQGKLVAVPQDVPGNALAFTLKDAQFRSYDHADNTVAELESGGIAALVADYTTARRIVVDHAGLHIVPGMLTTTYYTVAMRTVDTLHMNRFNNTLAALLGGYTYEQLHMKWFGYPLLNVAVPDSVSARWEKR